MTVGVCGFGYSGSGAVWDLLKEYSNCDCVAKEEEFLFACIPDGLEDLRFHLEVASSRFQSSDVALMRFDELTSRMGKNRWNTLTGGKLHELSLDFLNSITQLEWDGFWLFDQYKVEESVPRYCLYRLKRKANSILKKHKHSEIQLIKSRKMRLSINPDNFLESSRRFIDGLILSLRTNNAENVIINQPFPANNPLPYFKYFDNPKAIIVKRDPRDVYLTLKRIQDQGSRWFAHDDVEGFISYYKILHNGLSELTGKDNILVISFEDLIYKYEETKQVIESFIGNCGEHYRIRKCFNPDTSIKNTQLFRYYKEFTEDITLIERELGEYLYNFDPNIDILHDHMF